ncbi:MAG: hypothetical protein AB1529_06500 [Candidatus Micrarchaeota archaeon]
MARKKKAPAPQEQVAEEKKEASSEVQAAKAEPAPAPQPAEKKEASPKAAPSARAAHHAEKKESPAKPVSSRGDSLPKTLAIAVLLVVAIAMALYFFVFAGSKFATGQEVDAETFKGIFLDAEKVYIVMDVRSAPDGVSNNVLQCGVDFAASSGMGGKTVTPLSMGREGCVAPDGVHTYDECFAMLKDGITIYVKDGPGGARYYSNGMVVTVGPEYKLGACGIART